jgi:hypothetical protein
MTKFTDDFVCVSGYITNTFINTNWRAVLKQMGQPMYDALALKIHRIFSEAAKTVPYKDIFDDPE